MNKKTFNQLFELKLIELGINDTLEDVTKSTKELIRYSNVLGKTYLRAKIENIAENMEGATNKMKSNNKNIEKLFDNIVSLI